MLSSQLCLSGALLDGTQVGKKKKKEERSLAAPTAHNDYETENDSIYSGAGNAEANKTNRALLINSNNTVTSAWVKKATDIELITGLFFKKLYQHKNTF